MRITKIEGYPEWPITFTCPQFPEVSFEISLPSDMRIKREYNHILIEDTLVAEFSKEAVGIECPICGHFHELDDSKIPPIIRIRIPIIMV